MVLMLLVEEMLGKVLNCPEQVELLRNIAAAVAFVAQATLWQDVNASEEGSETGLVPVP